MAANTMKDRISRMRENIRGATENLKEGFSQVPAAVYVGNLTRCAPIFSKSGNAQLYRRYQITAGEHKGKSVGDYQHLENEVGLAICCQFLREMGFEAEPDDIFDLDLSEKKSDLIFSEEFKGACEQIAADRPACQFRVDHRPGQGDFTFTDVTVIEWIGDSSVNPNPAADTGSESPGGDTGKAEGNERQRAGRTVPEKEPEPELTETDKKLLEFGLKIGAEVKKTMDGDQLREILGAFEYPVEGVKTETLVSKGYSKKDITPEAFITKEDGELLQEAGLGEVVIWPEPEPEPEPAKAAPRRMMRRK